MKYEKPELEIIIFATMDVVRTSPGSKEQSGEGDGYGDGGWQS